MDRGRCGKLAHWKYRTYVDKMGHCPPMTPDGLVAVCPSHHDPRGKGPTAFDSLLVFLRSLRQRACPGPASPAAYGHLCSMANGSQGLATGHDRTSVTRCVSHAPQMGPGRDRPWRRWGTHRPCASCSERPDSRRRDDGEAPEASAAALNARRSLTSPPPASVAGSCFLHSRNVPKGLPCARLVTSARPARGQTPA